MRKESVFRLRKKFGSFLLVRFSVFDAPSHQKAITKENPQVRAKSYHEVGCSGRVLGSIVIVEINGVTFD